MLCPCCGNKIERTARECGCGGRFVGDPLDEAPIQVQSLGPAMTAALLLVVVAGSALLFTKWLAFAAVLVVWTAVRAMKLARRDPEWYGGYRAAAGVLVLTIVSGVVATGYGVAWVPQFLENRKARKEAATLAGMYHVYITLEEYKRANGSYPSNTQEIKRATNEPLPVDYWGGAYRYTSYTEATAGLAPGVLGITFYNFELRSAGPDEEMGTDDDIVMRDGVPVTNPEEIKQPIAKDSTGR